MSELFGIRPELLTHTRIDASLYRTYFHKNASGKEIVRVSHYFIGAWAVWMGAWGVIVSSVDS